MYDYTINISDKIDPIIKQLINDYWLFSNNEFIYSFNQLTEKYGLTSSEITRHIKKFSICEVSTCCTNCNKTFLRKVETKGFFKISTCHTILCLDCEEKEKLQREESKKRQEEESQRRREKYQQTQNEKKEKFAEAIQSKQWLDLNAFEIDILRKIIESKGIKKNVRDIVFNGDFYNKYIWNIINKLERKGLIYVERSEYNSSIIRFDFDESLIHYIEEEYSIDIIDYLSFSLSKRVNEKTNLKQPDYSGTFTLPCDVVLKAGENIYMVDGH